MSLLKSNPLAFEQLLELVRGYLRHAALSFSTSVLDREDLVQEALLHLYLNRQKYDTSKDALSWIMWISKNLWRDIYRRGQATARKCPVAIEPLIDRIDKVDSSINTQETVHNRLDIEYLLDKIPDGELIRWRFFEELNLEVIAQRLDLTRVPATKRLDRALRLLKVGLHDS